MGHPSGAFFSEMERLVGKWLTRFSVQAYISKKVGGFAKDAGENVGYAFGFSSAGAFFFASASSSSSMPSSNSCTGLGMYLRTSAMATLNLCATSLGKRFCTTMSLTASWKMIPQVWLTGAKRVAHVVSSQHA